MIIVTGHIVVQAGRRDEFVALSKPAMTEARKHDSCQMFVVAADPLEADRVVVSEVWTSRADLLAFRGQGPGADLSGLIVSAAVRDFSVPDA
ncbi:putative quinol monooxygenase [Tabrizicola sp.]|uniref:putative quinol monooxygenase n=1 Tax=Tabrizicola sp. TaxID=2005166 RepID=UPI003F3634DF